MSDLIMFLTSKEVIIIYIILFLACFLSLIIYLVEKGSVFRKRRHNTRELNKLVKKVKAKAKIEEDNTEEYYEEPVLEIKTGDSAVSEMLDNTRELDIKIETNEPKKEEEELLYTTIEPDRETARLELKKIREALEQQEREKEQEEYKEEIVIEEENYSDTINSFEEKQEEDAIISLDELLEKGKSLYDSNEKTQYIDDDTAPISLEELATQAGGVITHYDEPFIIENVVPKEELIENVSEVMVMDDFNTVKDNNIKRFKNTPFISPIYGIDKRELELENTANYDKFDKEINKSNEFIMSLKDLQDKLKN
ncbi:MAG: hypothetical protein IJ842_05070 [Bacilli bacterium]|nr:hypothetical protein [Bacilli bacterium]